MLRVLISQIVYFFIVGIILSSCATVEDPSKSGGIVSTATNVFGGTYDARLEKRKAILAEHQAEGQLLDTKTQGLESEKLTITQQLDIEKQKLQDIEVAIAQLEKDIQNDQTALSVDEQKRETILRKLNTLKQKNKKLQHELDRKKNASTKEANRLQAERDNLDKELTLLLEILNQE